MDVRVVLWIVVPILWMVSLLVLGERNALFRRKPGPTVPEGVAFIVFLGTSVTGSLALTEHMGSAAWLPLMTLLIVYVGKSLYDARRQS